MKFSVCLSTGFEGVMYPIPFATPEDFIAQGKLCERLGYHSVWGNDHITTQDYVRKLFPNQPPNFYEPMMVLAAIGASTTKLKLGTALTVLPMHDPVYLAKQAITLDQMTGGVLWKSWNTRWQEGGTAPTSTSGTGSGSGSASSIGSRGSSC